MGDVIATRRSRGPVMLPSTRSGDCVVIATRWSRGSVIPPSARSGERVVIMTTAMALRRAGLEGKHCYPRDGLIRAPSLRRAVGTPGRVPHLRWIGQAGSVSQDRRRLRGVVSSRVVQDHGWDELVVQERGLQSDHNHSMIVGRSHNYAMIVSPPKSSPWCALGHEQTSLIVYWSVPASLNYSRWLLLE